MFGKKNKKIKLIPRLLIYLFIIIACTQTISSLFLFNSPEYAMAQDPLSYTLQTEIGGVKEIKFDSTTRPIANYIKLIYKYAIGAVGIIAAVVLMIGGVIWLTAGGSTARVALAKDFIGSSLAGLVLVFCSYLIFYQINPDLMELRISDIKTVPKEEGEVGGVGNPKCKWTQLDLIIPLSGDAYPEECMHLYGIKWKEKDGFCGGAKPETEKDKLKVVCCCPPIPKECLDLKPPIPRCTDCKNCASLAPIECKHGCQVTGPLAEKLKEGYKRENRTYLWRITEAWPPKSGAHRDDCHYNGTCVDLNLTGWAIDDAEAVVLTFKELSEIGGMKIEYETENNCDGYNREAERQGVTDFVCRDLEHISAQHYSVYLK